MATIKDIAKAAGVSSKTVSLVLNGKLKEKRRDARLRAEKIRQLAKELGYRTNVAARATVSGRFFSHGVIIPSPGTGYFPWGFFHGLTQRLDEMRLRLVLGEYNPQRYGGENIPLILHDYCVDAIAVEATYPLPKELINHLTSYQIPSVLINYQREFDTIYPDDFLAGQMAGEHLWECGYRQIVYVLFRSQDPQDIPHYSEHERLKGLISVIHQHGGTVNTWIIDPYKEDVCHSLYQKLSSQPLPQAIVGYEEREMLAIRFVLKELNLRVPEDIGVIYFTWRESWALPIPNTAIYFSGHEFGRTLAEYLETKYQNKNTLLPSAQIRPTLSLPYLTLR